MIIDDSYISYINLASRTDRNDHMIKELARIDLNAIRQEAFLPSEFQGPKYEVMRRRTPGAIGCYMSQLVVMAKALNEGQHAFVMEDDLVFCDDFKERIEIIDKFLSENQWDVFWMGGTYHTEPTWHKNPHPQDMKYCTCTLNRDYEPTDNARIVRTYGAFSTHCYIVNRHSISKVISLLDGFMQHSIGIDFSFIYLQPSLKTFAFVPGCVKQMDNLSNIGNGMTYFSGFEKLGPHWFQNKIQ